MTDKILEELLLETEINRKDSRGSQIDVNDCVSHSLISSHDVIPTSSKCVVLKYKRHTVYDGAHILSKHLRVVLTCHDDDSVALLYLTLLKGV